MSVRFHDLHYVIKSCFGISRASQERASSYSHLLSSHFPAKLPAERLTRVFLFSFFFFWGVSFVSFVAFCPNCILMQLSKSIEANFKDETFPYRKIEREREKEREMAIRMRNGPICTYERRSSRERGREKEQQ